MKTKATLLLALFCVTLMLPVANAQTETNQTGMTVFYPDIFVVRMPSYEVTAPVRIVVNFMYTNNVTVNVKTYGQSLYRAVSSPVSVEFTTSQVDVYLVQVMVRYDVWVNQTVTIGFIEENSTRGAAKNPIEFTIAGKGFDIDMVVNVAQAIQFPTAQEISDMLWMRWQNELLRFEGVSKGMVDKMVETNAVVGALAIISFVVVVVLLFAVFNMQRKVARLEMHRLREAS